MLSNGFTLALYAAVATVAIGAEPGSVGRVAAASQSLEGDAYLLVVTGLGGTEDNRSSFHEWADTLISSAESSMGVSSDRIIYLAEDPQIDPERIDARSTSENVENALRRLAEQAAPTDRIVIVLIGHGSYRNGESRINLPGPDLTADRLAGLLDLFPAQAIAVVNTTSASGDFVAALSAPNRVIITATRDGHQNNSTVFAHYFVEAYSGDAADLDKDERVSLLEAYEYAIREVQRFYENEGRLLTETALLDDDGDGEGVHSPDPSVSDGQLSRRFFLASSSSPGGGRANSGAATPEDPELRPLLEQKRALEERIEELRRIKDSMNPETYMTELEALLVELALTERRISELGGEGTNGVISGGVT
jgi:hypothetical protein